MLQFERTNARFSRGLVGVFTNGAAARFRRIKLTDLEGKVVLEGLPELPRADNKTIRKDDTARAPPPDRRGNRREDCPNGVGGALEDSGDFVELARDEVRADPARRVSDGVAQIRETIGIAMSSDTASGLRSRSISASMRSLKPSLNM